MAIIVTGISLEGRIEFDCKFIRIRLFNRLIIGDHSDGGRLLNV